MRGLIGADLLSRYAIKIDPVHHTVALFDARTFSASGETILPLIVKNDRYYVDATLDVRPGLTVTDRFRVDTGSGDSFDDPAAAKAVRTRSTTLGNGLGKNFQASSGEYAAAHLGPFTWRNVWGPATPTPFVGMEILRRFVVTFDAAQGKLYLRATASLNEPVPQPPG